MSRILSLLCCCLAGAALAAASFDNPPVAKEFRGEIEAQVQWVHSSTNWAWIDALRIEPEDGAAADFQPLLDAEGLRLTLRWSGPTTPDPTQHAWLNGLQAGQRITIPVTGQGNGHLRLERVPTEQGADVRPAPAAAAGSDALRELPAGRDADRALVADDYEWRNVPIGGGGYSVGLEFHPTVADLVYLRTDVAGLQRRKPDEERWQLITRNTFTPEYGRMSGCAGAALPAGDPARIFIAIGGGAGSRSGIYHSDDYGEHWQLVLPLMVDGNQGEARKYGPAMAADPRNDAVVYYASQQDGLWLTHGGGMSEGAWRQCDPAVIPPNTEPKAMSRAVVIDPTGGTVGEGADQRSRVVYVATGHGRVFRSTDGGETFAELPPHPGHAGEAGSQGTIRYLSIGADGLLYAAHDRGLAVWDPATDAWRDATPEGAGRCSGVGASAQEPGAVVALFPGPKHKHDHVWTSRDAGATWREAGFELGEVPGPDFGLFAAPCSVFIDPHHPQRAWYTDAFQVWRCDDVWAETVVWDALKRGHEETIMLSGASVAGGPRLLAGMADIRGFVWDEDVTDFGRRIDWERHAPSTNRTSFDASPADPRIIYAASRGPALDGKTGHSGGGRGVCIGAVHRSDDGGASWKPVTQPFAGTPFAAREAGGAKLAVSATDPQRVVYLQREGGLRLTTDGGESWQDVAAADHDGDGILHNRIAYDFRHVLAADRVDGEVFYLYRRGDGGQFLRSEDGGASFRVIASASADLPEPLERAGGEVAEYSGTWGLKVATAPGLAGEVWISLAGSGIWRAAGAGGHPTDRFVRVAYFAQQGPTNVAFGPPLPGSEQPTVYVFGQRARDGQWGVFRSSDLGATWQQTTPSHQPGNWIRFMVADAHHPGTLYLGDASFGITVGRHLE